MYTNKKNYTDFSSNLPNLKTELPHLSNLLSSSPKTAVQHQHTSTTPPTGFLTETGFLDHSDLDYTQFVLPPAPSSTHAIQPPLQIETNLREFLDSPLEDLPPMTGFSTAAADSNANSATTLVAPTSAKETPKRGKIPTFKRSKKKSKEDSLPPGTIHTSRTVECTNYQKVSNGDV